MSASHTFTPREVVSELDRYIVGQRDAKRALAIALRNRARRRAVGGELARDITPRNILMIGPTGVGQIAELTLQLRGDAGARQHRGAEVGLAHMVGVGAVCYVHLLRRS